jgi:TPR repeat protein
MSLLLPAQTFAEAEVAKISPEEHVTMARDAFEKADIVSTMSHYRKAADAGYAPAMIRLAYLLDKSEANEESIEWFKKAAELGEAEAQFELARMTAYGEGIELDKKKALDLFTQSANQGFISAIHVLAIAYENGGLDLRVDYESAQHWLQRGQQLNDIWLTRRLAQAYRKGELGLRINRKKAEQLELQLALLTELKDQSQALIKKHREQKLALLNEQLEQKRKNPQAELLKKHEKEKLALLEKQDEQKRSQLKKHDKQKLELLEKHKEQ